MKVINKNGKAIDFYTAVELMDAEICVKLNDDLAPFTKKRTKKSMAKIGS